MAIKMTEAGIVISAIISIIACLISIIGGIVLLVRHEIWLGVAAIIIATITFVIGISLGAIAGYATIVDNAS